MSSDLLKQIFVSIRLIRKLKHDELDATVSKELRRLERHLQSLIEEEADRTRISRGRLLEVLERISKWVLALTLVHRGIESLTR